MCVCTRAPPRSLDALTFRGTCHVLYLPIVIFIFVDGLLVCLSTGGLPTATLPSATVRGINSLCEELTGKENHVSADATTDVVGAIVIGVFGEHLHQRF